MTNRWRVWEGRANLAEFGDALLLSHEFVFEVEHGLVASSTRLQLLLENVALLHQQLVVVAQLLRNKTTTLSP